MRNVINAVLLNTIPARFDRWSAVSTANDFEILQVYQRH